MEPYPQLLYTFFSHPSVPFISAPHFPLYKHRDLKLNSSLSPIYTFLGLQVEIFPFWDQKRTKWTQTHLFPLQTTQNYKILHMTVKKLQKYVDGFHLHKGREVADFHRDLTANFFACAIGINLNDTVGAC